MPSQQTDNEEQTNSVRRTLGTSALFGKRSSKSNTTKTHIRIVPSIDNPSRSLIFSIVERDLEVGRTIKIGRFTDRSSIQNHISFKSKVVSRSHCEIWLNNDGKVYLRDTKSSSGTFVNHIRLSPANSESKPMEIQDGDLVQLGVDYQGGYEEIYRSVKMKFEINRSEQPKPVSYTMSVYNNIRQLTNPKEATKKSVEVEECCICLYALAPFQALFVAPCSHSYHFKCIRPLFESYPGFQCPICRTYSDLEASVAMEVEEVIEKYGLRKPSNAEASLQQQKRSNINPTSILPITPEPPLSTTLVACTNSLSGIISSPTTSPSDISNLEQIVSRDYIAAGDHRATMIVDDTNNVINEQEMTNNRNSGNNLVEKIKMTLSSNSNNKLNKRPLSNESSSSSDEDIMERSETFFDLPSTSRNALQPLLSRQSTHYNPLNGVLEELN